MLCHRALCGSRYRFELPVHGWRCPGHCPGTASPLRRRISAMQPSARVMPNAGSRRCSPAPGGIPGLPCHPGPGATRLGSTSYAVIPLLPLQSPLPGQDRLRLDDADHLLHQQPAQRQRGFSQRSALLSCEAEPARYLLPEYPLLQAEVLVVQRQLPAPQARHGGDHRHPGSASSPILGPSQHRSSSDRREYHDRGCRSVLGAR